MGKIEIEEKKMYILSVWDTAATRGIHNVWRYMFESVEQAEKFVEGRRHAFNLFCGHGEWDYAIDSTEAYIDVEGFIYLKSSNYPLLISTPTP